MSDNQSSVRASWLGAWRHAHEEDTSSEMVFRHLDVDLPPSRGRMGFTLHPNGSATFSMPGRDDRGMQSDALWHVVGANGLRVESVDSQQILLQGIVVQCDEERMLLKPLH